MLSILEGFWGAFGLPNPPQTEFKNCLKFEAENHIFLFDLLILFYKFIMRRNLEHINFLMRKSTFLKVSKIRRFRNLIKNYT